LGDGGIDYVEGRGGNDVITKTGGPVSILFGGRRKDRITFDAGNQRPPNPSLSTTVSVGIHGEQDNDRIRVTA
jgi:hypothetical protein